MDKNRFETQKEVVNLDPTVHNIQSLFTVDDLKWLIAQAEKVERLRKKNNRLINEYGVEVVLDLLKDETKNIDDNEMLSFNVSFVKDIIEEIERKEKNTIATILAYVEKNHDAPEIEEYLWELLDKGTEFE